jgi:hypothetical protein
VCRWLSRAALQNAQGLRIFVSPGGSLSSRERVALTLLLAAAALQGAWNAWAVPPLTGYDAGGHAGYIRTIVVDGRLPHPLEGWSTFHPPLYYLLGSVIWRLMEQWGGPAVLAALRGVGVIALLATGFASYRGVRWVGGRPSVAWAATALTLFLPSAQMASAMIGNEAFASGIAGLALLAVLRLEQDPRNARSAAAAGILAGLACMSKYSGTWVACACAVPFVRPGFDHRTFRALAICFGLIALLAGPVYLRNVALTGAPTPMTLQVEPMRSIVAGFIPRPHLVRDYLWLPPTCLLHPSMYLETGRPGNDAKLNPSMANVWGMTYASTWWDAFGHRIPRGAARGAAPILPLLGLIPTSVAVLGFLAALHQLGVARRRSPLFPAVVMAGLALASFIAFTARIPAPIVAKGSYLLPLAVPAALFFAHGAELLGRRLRMAVIAVAIFAALTAAVFFTSGLVFAPLDPGPMLQGWHTLSKRLPGAGISEAVSFLAEQH